jgi:hypothetical protein
MTDGRRLYHYTALHHAEEIRRSGGISRGGVPVPSADGETVVGLARGWQWLTSDAGWAQSWATRQSIECDRTECRFVVEIPLLELHRLHRWDRSAGLFGFGPDAAKRFAELGGGTEEAARSWWLFKGRIPAAWLVGLERRPA